MTKMDEAVAGGLAAAAALNDAGYDNTQHLVAAFHRALRERGYCVIAIDDVAVMADDLERNFEHGRDAAVADCKICQAIIRFRAMIAAAQEG